MQPSSLIPATHGLENLKGAPSPRKESLPVEVEPERDPCSSFPLSSFGLGDGHTFSKSQRVGRCLASLTTP